MGIIETRIKKAAGMLSDGKIVDAIKEVADVADCSVRSASHSAIMYNAIRLYFGEIENGGKHGKQKKTKEKASDKTATTS